MWNKITNPKTGRKVYTHTRLGKSILRTYIQQLGGSIGEKPAFPVMSKKCLSLNKEYKLYTRAGKMKDSEMKVAK